MSKIKYLLFFISFIFLINCSFDRTSGIWNDLSDELKKAKDRDNTTLIFSSVKKFDEEIKNKNTIEVSKAFANKNWTENNYESKNHIPHLSYLNKKNLILKSKKLGKNSFNLESVNFEPVTENNTIFFYDPSGNIFSYSIDTEKLNWKYNFYKKRFKNIPKEINLNISEDGLVISDNLGFVYSLDKISGKIRWAKNYGVAFKSNIKIDGENIFMINQDNKFYVLEKNSGGQRLDLETLPSFLKSENKPNISLDNIKKNVYFITSSAEIYSLNYKNRNINWLFNLTGTTFEKKTDLFYSSPIVHVDDELFLSSSLSTFSMNAISGALNWEFPFSTKIRPIISKNNIFLVSHKGFLLNLDRKQGKVIWSGNLFKSSKKLGYEKTGNITSMMLISDQLFMTTKRGYFLFLDYQNGKILNYAKVSKGFFSKPIILDETILVIDKKMRILQFN